MAEICNERETFTFHAVWVPRSAPAGPMRLRWRNGAAFLRVDGGCRYFVGAAEANTPVVTGVLTGDEAIQLAEETAYADWASLDGMAAAGLVVDALVVILNDGEHELACGGGCTDYPTEESRALAMMLEPMVDASIAWHERLETAGTPVDGDVRFAAVRHDKANLGLWPWGFATWPLDAPVEDFAVALDEVDSTGFVASGEDAAALRALRDQVRTTPIAGGATGHWVPIDGGEFIYEVVITDVLPYEDAKGIVPRRSGS